MPTPATRLMKIIPIALLLVASSAAAQTQRPVRPPKPGAALEKAIAQLTTEATEAMAAARVGREEPDFKDRFGEDIPEKEILAALLAPQHREPFIDAYIRWQLTSYDPVLPEFDDQAFADFMDSAPRLVENPKADVRVLDSLRDAERAGPLAPAVVEQLRISLRELDERALVMEAMNRPAFGYREWVVEKLGETGPRPRQWMIEELAARITGGWEVAALKASMTRGFTDSVRDDTFTEDHRRLVIAQLSSLVGPGRKSVHEVTFYANGRIRLSESTVQVTRENIENWTKRLFGIE